MIFSRWTIVYKHDKQPVEECLFVHKAHAIKKHESMSNKDKCELKQIALMNKEFAEYLTKNETFGVIKG
jgi:hypothetical protein